MSLLWRTNSPNRFFSLPRSTGGGPGRGLAKLLTRTPALTLPRSTGGGRCSRHAQNVPRDTGFQPVPSAAIRNAALLPVYPHYSLRAVSGGEAA